MLPSKIISSNISLEQKIQWLAHRLVLKYSRGDSKALEEDLIMAGWEGYLSDKRDELLRLRKAQDYMVRAWVEWNFNSKKSKNSIRHELTLIQMSKDELNVSDNLEISTERKIIVNDLIEKLRKSVYALNNLNLKSRNTLARYEVVDVLDSMLAVGNPRKAKGSFYFKRKIQSVFRELLAA